MSLKHKNNQQDGTPYHGTTMKQIEKYRLFTIKSQGYNIKEGEHGAALTLITEMWERSIRPTGFAFSTIISVGVSNIWHGKQNNKPTEFTFGSVLGCAAWIVSMEQGRQLHSLALKVGLEADFVVSNSLMDMYAKTGNIDCAMKIFANMHSRDLVPWNTMIMGCS
ncbi:Pentatricopeptide repeat-containing protein [Nymphaea thermarum]|nr:Pentatricopeptide repeat-containing protein [Nymphaea thermarum]